MVHFAVTISAYKYALVQFRFYFVPNSSANKHTYPFVFRSWVYMVEIQSRYTLIVTASATLPTFVFNSPKFIFAPSIPLFRLSFSSFF